MRERPRRIQLSRRKGWRMSPNTVKIDRSTQWGNPYKAGIHMDHQHAVDCHRMLCTTGKMPVADAVSDVIAYRTLVQNQITDLSGKNLACWCPLDQPCHADVLLEIANPIEPSETE